jgi:hypothetical protein
MTAVPFATSCDILAPIGSVRITGGIPVGTSDKGTSVGKYLGKRNSGLRLAEHERVEVNLEAEDAIGMTAEEGSIVFTDLWVEDSLGRRYRVKNAREHLGVLLSSRSQSSLALNMDAQ